MNYEKEKMIAITDCGEAIFQHLVEEVAQELFEIKNKNKKIKEEEISIQNIR